MDIDALFGPFNAMELRDGRGNLLRQTENLRALGARTTAAPPALLQGAGENGEGD